MKYCHACGHANPDDGKFCEKCGTSVESGVQPGATSDAAGSDLGAKAKDLASSLSSSKIPWVPIAAAVGAIVVVAIIYSVFFKPMTASDYANAVDDYYDQVVSAQSGIQEATTDWRGTWDDYEDQDGDEGVNPVDEGDWQDYKAAVDEELATMRTASKKLAGLRAPKRYKDEQAELKAGCVVFRTEYADGLSNLMKTAAKKDNRQASKDIDELMTRLVANRRIQKFDEAYNDVAN